MMNLYILLPLIMLFCTSCFTKSFVHIEKSDTHSQQAGEIKKVVVIEPDYFHVNDMRKKNKLRQVKMESKENKLNKYLIANGKAAGIDVQVMDATSLEAEEIDYYNHMVQLKSDIISTRANISGNSETQSAHGFFSPPVSIVSPAPIISSEYSHLSTKYGTPYFMVSGTFTTISSNNIAARIVYGVLCIPCAPFLIKGIIKPDISTYILNVIVNVETGEIIYTDTKQLEDRMLEVNMNSVLHDTFFQLKKAKRVKG